MSKTLRTLVQLAPFIFFLLYIVVMLVVRQRVPQPPELMEALKVPYENYGYYLIFAGGVLEGLFLVGFYVPGSTVMLLGAALSAQGILSLPLVVLAGTSGLMLSYTVDYLLGRYGWHYIFSRFGMQEEMNSTKEKLEKHHVKSFLLGYISPGSASFVATASGVVKVPFVRFFLLSFLSQSVWGMMWGTIAFHAGIPLVEFMLKNLFFVVILLGMFWFGKKYFKKLFINSFKKS